MKVNLLLNSDSVRSGFLNVDPMADPGHPDKTIGDITNLDDLVDDAEADEIIALDVIDYVPAPALERVLTNWISKVRHGGTIAIGGVDIMAVARGLVRQEISLTQANVLLYGQQSAPWEYRKATIDMQTVISTLQKFDFKIIQKRIVNYTYVVKAERP